MKRRKDRLNARLAATTEGQEEFYLIGRPVPVCFPPFVVSPVTYSIRGDRRYARDKFRCAFSTNRQFSSLGFSAQQDTF
jgi:hypothetical protein